MMLNTKAVGPLQACFAGHLCACLNYAVYFQVISNENLFLLQKQKFNLFYLRLFSHSQDISLRPGREDVARAAEG